MLDTLWFDAGTALLILAAIALFIFPIRYGTSAAWWKTLAGRALLFRNTAICGVILMSLSWAIFGFYPGFDVVRFFISLILAVACIAFDVVFEIIRKGEKKRDEEEAPEAPESLPAPRGKEGLDQ